MFSKEDYFKMSISKNPELVYNGKAELVLTFDSFVSVVQVDPVEQRPVLLEPTDLVPVPLRRVIVQHVLLVKLQRLLVQLAANLAPQDIVARQQVQYQHVPLQHTRYQGRQPVHLVQPANIVQMRMLHHR